MNDDTDVPDGACNACHRRDPEYGLVCEPCRRWLPTALASLLELTARLADDLIPADDSTATAVLVCRTCNHTTPVGYPHHPGHPEYDHSPTGKWHGGWLTRHLIQRAAGPAPSIALDIIVTGGGHEAPVPLDLHAHDLLGPVIRDGGRPIDVTGDNWLPIVVGAIPHKVWATDGWRQEGRIEYRPAGDQIGVIPVAQLLDQEMRAWADAGAPGSRYRPAPTTPNLVDWLTKRLDWACDHYPGMDAFADTLSSTRGTLMGALGDFDPEPERCDGVACKRCDLRMLFRSIDGSNEVECQNPDCLKIYTATEYAEWVKEQGRSERSKALVA